MLRITRTVATVAALGTTLALAGSTASASAATAISDLPDTAPLVGKLYVPVTLTLACDGDPWFPFPFGGATVTIKQLVSGKTIAIRPPSRREWRASARNNSHESHSGSVRSPSSRQAAR